MNLVKRIHSILISILRPQAFEASWAGSIAPALGLFVLAAVVSNGLPPAFVPLRTHGSQLYWGLTVALFALSAVAALRSAVLTATWNGVPSGVWARISNALSPDGPSFSIGGRIVATAAYVFAAYGVYEHIAFEIAARPSLF